MAHLDTPAFHVYNPTAPGAASSVDVLLSRYMGVGSQKGTDKRPKIFRPRLSFFQSRSTDSLPSKMPVAKFPRMLSSLHLLLLVSPFLASTPAALPSSVGPPSGNFADGPFDNLLRNHSSVDKRDDTDDVDDFELIQSDLVEDFDEDFEKIDLSDDSDDFYGDKFDRWQKGTTKSFSEKNIDVEKMYYRDCEGPKVIVRKTKPFAEGNHGKVYAGRLWKENSQTHKFEDISDVAVKLSDPVKRDSGDSADSSQALEILNAADLQISVQSKNVVKGFAAFYVERAGAKVSAVTVMELITGATDLLKGRKALSEKKDKDRLAYYKPLLNGVQAIHEMGIGHLGLKPANILLDDSLPKGQSAPAKVKITDFDRAYAGWEASMSLVVLNDYFTPPGMYRIRGYSWQSYSPII